VRSGSVRVLTALFHAFSEAHSHRVPALKRSQDDKEYIIQDWVEARSVEAGCGVVLQGRNSYPDFWLTRSGTTIGNEVKSLAHLPTGRAPRKDVDFNSTLPDRSSMSGSAHSVSSCIVKNPAQDHSSASSRRYA
jgi:hypothetical protein